MPDKLDVMNNVLFFPPAGKHMLMILVNYFGTADESFKYWHDGLASIAGLTVVADTIAPAKYIDFVRSNTENTPPMYLGRSHCINLRGTRVEKDSARILGKAFAKSAPGGGGAFLIHSLHGPHARRGETNCPKGVFGAREEHLMVEIIGVSAGPPPEAEALRAATAWGDALFAALRDRGDGVIKGSYYPSLTPDEEMKGVEVFGTEGWEILRRLKKEMDPDNVFKHTIPRFDV
jgi:hypothetical protein